MTVHKYRRRLMSRHSWLCDTTCFRRLLYVCLSVCLPVCLPVCGIFIVNSVYSLIGNTPRNKLFSIPGKLISAYHQLLIICIIWWPFVIRRHSPNIPLFIPPSLPYFLSSCPSLSFLSLLSILIYACSFYPSLFYLSRLFPLLVPSFFLPPVPPSLHHLLPLHIFLILLFICFNHTYFISM